MKGELARIATQYAEATLELAEQSGAAEIVLKDLQVIASVFNSTPELSFVLHHPSVPPEEKTDLVIKTFEGKVNELTLRLLQLLCDRRRLDIVVAVEEEFRALMRERQHIVSAELFCADELDARQLADIKARLTEHLGKRLDLKVELDKTLIGGLMLKIGDQVIDGSIKGKLQEIEKELLSV